MSNRDVDDEPYDRDIAEPYDPNSEERGKWLKTPGDGEEFEGVPGPLF